MGYLMKTKDVDGVYDQYLNYGDPTAGALASSLTSLQSAIETFYHMDSFKGTAAVALKSYLMDMHRVFIANIKDLCELLRTEYALKYMQRYSQAPVSEGGDAVLPEDELEQKRGILAYAKDARILSLDEHLTAVARLLPAGTWPAIPHAGNLQSAFAAAHDDVERLKNEVRRIEEEGQRLFQSGGLFLQHLTQLKQVIQETTLDAAGAVRYEGGSFFATDAAVGLSALSQQTAATVSASKGALIAVHDEMLDRQVLREEEAYRLLEEGRSQWELVAIAGSVIGTLASAAAILGTGGAAAVVSGAGALKSATDTIGRIQAYASGKNSSANLDANGSQRTVVSSLASSSASVATSAISSFAKGSSGTAILTGTAKSTVSMVGKASQAVTVLADANQTRMRDEAQARLARIEALRARRSAQAA